MHNNSVQLFQKYAIGAFSPGIRVLEIGPDQHPSTYQQLIDDSSITWDTIDIFEDTRLTYKAASECEFPIPDEQYDIVLSGQVIEHVRKPWQWLKEVARVCRFNGLVITLNPINWPHHRHPLDCWRIYPDGLQSLYDDAGLKVELCTFESIDKGQLLNIKTTGFGVKKAGMKGRLSLALRFLLGRTVSVLAPIDAITIGRRFKGIH